MEAVFVDSEDDAVNRDSKAEMLFSKEEAEEPGQSAHNKASTSTAASSKASAEKHSKKRALRKAEKKLLLKRIRGVSTVFLWQKVSCMSAKRDYFLIWNLHLGRLKLVTKTI